MENVRNIKCVIVGAIAVGKTSLLNSYVTSPNSSVAPFENYNGIKVEIEQDGEIFRLELWDTNSADYSRDIRKSYYEKCSVVLICYSVMDHDSFKDVKKKWIPEVKKCCPTALYILIGTKNDLRSDKVSLLRLDRLKNLQPITLEQGQKMARKTSAVKYLECSAFSGEGLKEIFQEVIKTHIDPPVIKDGSCTVL